MDATKPYEFIGFGAMDAAKPYEFIGFGAMDAAKPYEFIGFGLRPTFGRPGDLSCKLSRIESGRYPARKPDLRPGSTMQVKNDKFDAIATGRVYTTRGSGVSVYTPDRCISATKVRVPKKRGSRQTRPNEGKRR
jgi:hypothetical protein